jgi:hypothetical protein
MFIACGEKLFFLSPFMGESEKYCAPPELSLFDQSGAINIAPLCGLT